MAKTIRNASQSNNASGTSGIGSLLGVAVLIIIVVLFFVYAFPAILGLIGNGKSQGGAPQSVDRKAQQPNY